MELNRHEDRTVIVTGASSGIGRGIARRFAEEGADIVVADVRRTPKQGRFFDQEVTEPIDEWIERETRREALYVETDVSDPEQVQEMVEETVDYFGGIDVLVNNAGIFVAGNSQEIDVEDWNRVTGVDLDGSFFCAKFAIPHLVASQGQIINIGSVHATEGGGGPPYASSKAAVVNLTRDLAVELGPDVNVNAICPGFIETPIADYMDEEGIEVCLEHILLSRLGVPEDIGDAAVFLASDEASYIHGESLYVDGGWTAHRL